MKIIPAIDILEGKCVRLTKGNFNAIKTYYENPIDIAKIYEDAGAEYLHIVDLDAAKGNGNNIRIIKKISDSTNLKIQMGGGIRNKEILDQLFNAGIDKAIIGSLAITQPQLIKQWIKDYGNDKLIIGADVNEGYIAMHGWLETSGIKLQDFIIDYMNAGANTFLCTDISKDGMLAGIAINLYKNIIQKFEGINLIASGGVASINDIVLAKENNLYAIVIGKALYENRISLPQLFDKC